MFSKIGLSSARLPEGFSYSLHSINRISLIFKGLEAQIDCGPHFSYHLDEEKRLLSLKCVSEADNLSKRSKRAIRSLAGTNMRLLSNLISGLEKPFTKIISLEGVGFKVIAVSDGRLLLFELGFSHPIVVSLPDSINVSLNSQTKLSVSSVSKSLLGDFCSVLTSRLRKRDPYHNKGIMEVGKKLITKVVNKK